MTQTPRVDARTTPQSGSRIEVVGLTTSSNRSELELLIDGAPATVWTDTTSEIDPGLTPWVPALASLGLKSGRIVASDRGVDSTAVRGAEAAIEMLVDWFPDIGKPTTFDLAGEESTNSRAETRGVGCFFSGGVDSFYSALQRDDDVTHYIIIHGLDISLDNYSLWEQTESRVRAAAAEMGKELIVVRTNLRTVMTDFGADWYTQGHGPFLAHVALLLTPVLREVTIPASAFAADHLTPYSTHPDLDPLWSSSQVQIVHHGVTARHEKVRALLDSDVAMRHLRVCWWNLTTSYNCGQCEKCLRTMIALHAMDGLERCETFDDQISLWKLKFAKVDESGDGGNIFAEENLAVLEELGKGDSDVADALRFAMNRGPVSNTIANGLFWGRIGTGAVGHIGRALISKARRRENFDLQPTTGRRA